MMQKLGKYLLVYGNFRKIWSENTYIWLAIDPATETEALVNPGTYSIAPEDFKNLKTRAKHFARFRAVD